MGGVVVESTHGGSAVRFVLLMFCFGLFICAEAATVTVSLDELSPFSALHMTCDSDEQGVDIPIPDRWTVTRVTADVHYTASLALVSDSSQIIFKINNTPFALTRLGGSSPDMRVTLNVPVHYLHSGYNSLTFRVIHATETLGCAAPCSPDKFTNVNLADSSLAIEYEEKPVPLELSSIAGFLFDSKILPEGRVNLITEDQSAESLTQAGIVASGIARRYDYRTVIFSVSNQLRPGMDNVIIGRKDFVGPLLSAHGMSLGSASGGYLKIFPLPAAGAEPDPTHALVAVTGLQHDHVKLAAETFANLSVNFPGTQELDSFAFQIPEIPIYAGREVLQASKTYDFKTLNFPTTTYKGINPVAKTITFRLPADFLIKQNLVAKMNLNFSYGAGARGDSALNIVVNDTAVRAIRLGDQEGGFFKDYAVDLPTFLFKPGRNVIAFGLELHPSAETCPLLPGNLFLTMFENSTLSFPDMPHFVEMPKLELFMLNGFPFTRWPDGYESVIYIPETAPEVVAAAMNLIGMITQKNGFPLMEMRIVVKPPTGWAGDVLILGRPAQLPVEMQTSSLLAANGRWNFPYPIVRDWADSYTFAHSTQSGGLGPRQGMLLEFESPYQVGRSILLIAAENPRTLFDLSIAIMDPEIQGQVKGGITLVDLGTHYDKPRVTSIRAERTYTTGKGKDISWLESFLYTHPGAFYGLLAALVLALAWALYIVLTRYRMSRKLGRDAAKAG